MKKGTRYIRHAFALGLLLMLTIVSFAYAEDGFIDIDRAQIQELDRAVRSYTVGEGGAINPNQARIWELEREDKYRRERKESDDSDITYATIQAVEYTTITAPTLGGKGKWILSYNTKYYGTPIKTIVRLLMKDYSDDYTTVYYKECEGFPSVVTSPTIVSGGEYFFSVYVKSTTSGSGAYGGDYYFSIADDIAHTSLTEKVASIVASCKAGTQWQTALNLHDWIVNHVYYDHNLEYSGADMILRGYGVCDGYSKAFYMLCKKAGIRVERVFGSINGVGHAWNVIFLDGNWYYVDCTWDDPGSDKVAKSGNEDHTFFCLNADLLALDHPKPWEWEKTTVQSCTALDDNYYVRLNKWNDLGNRYRNDAYEWTSYSEEIAKQIAANRGGNYVDFSDYYYIKDNLGWSITYPIKQTPIIRNWRLLAYAMSKQPMYIPGYGYVSIDVYFNESYKCFIYGLNGYTIKETGTFTLPASLTAIDEEVFLNTSASTIIIPSGCKSIGKKAFSGSNVHRIYIPESVTSIEESAFDGCSSVLIFCNYDSEARAFAQDHNILWHYP